MVFVSVSNKPKYKKIMRVLKKKKTRKKVRRESSKVRVSYH